MNTSTMQRFVGVDVPHTSQYGLVKKSSLHSPPGSAQTLTEMNPLDRGRLRPKTCQKAFPAILNRAEQVHTAETPWIDERHSDRTL